MSKCKCTLAQTCIGDGCRYCQPQEYIDKLEDHCRLLGIEIENYQAEITSLENDVQKAEENAIPDDLRADVLELCDSITELVHGKAFRDQAARISERLRKPYEKT